MTYPTSLPFQNLLNLLKYISNTHTADFAGTGLVMYRELDALPMYSMRPELQTLAFGTTGERIVASASLQSPHHDGFHLLTHELELTHSWQYLAPPIVHSVVVPTAAHVGARYLTALFASRLPSVIATAIVGADKRSTVFVRGTTVFESSI